MLKLGRLNNTLLHAIFWILACAIAITLSKFARDGLFFRDLDPVPIRANPFLLKAGISFSITTFIGSLILFYFKGIPKKISAILYGTAYFLAIGVVLCGLFPGTGIVVARNFVDTLEPKMGKTIFAFPVFFENAIGTLSDEEKHRLQDAFSVLRFCEAGTIWVRGFASSASFAGKTKEQSDELNRTLANDRANNVKVTLMALVHEDVKNIEWQTHNHMLEARRLKDTSIDGGRLSDVEALNRRVEIFWNDSPCIKLTTPVSGSQEADSR